MEGCIVVILIYVDDLIIRGDSKSEIDNLKKNFGNTISYEGFGRAEILSWH